MNLTQFQEFRKVLRKYPLQNHEFEFRLGKKTKNRFDTNIGEDLYKKIHASLVKYGKWEKIEEFDESIFYKSPDYRIIIDNTKDAFIHQTKRKLETIDHEIDKSPLDIRLAISFEKECEDRECEMEREVRRLRTSFHRKGVIISCTQVKGTPSDRDEESDTMYQVEIEFVPAKDDVTLYNQMHKVFNVLELVRET